MMDKQITSDVPLATFFSALEGINTVRKYLIKFEVNDSVMDTHTHSGSQVKVYRVQQKVKQPLIIVITDTWNT